MSYNDDNVMGVITDDDERIVALVEHGKISGDTKFDLGIRRVSVWRVLRCMASICSLDPDRMLDALVTTTHEEE